MTASPDKTSRPAIVLFRHDLRVADNRALTAAAGSGRPVLPVFVLDEETQGTRRLGGARRWWLHHSLAALSQSLSGLGAPLVLRRGEMWRVVLDFVKETGAELVVWNRRHDPPGMAADALMKSALKERGISAESFDGQLLHEPWALKTGSGGHYRVFTPFWRALSAAGEPRAPLPAPSRLRGLDEQPASDRLDGWELLPTAPDWAGGLRETWTPGEAGAHGRLGEFLGGAIEGYAETRDRPDLESTSRLSPHLAHGEMTPFQIWQALAEAGDAPPRDAGKFRKEVAWREFSAHLLFHNPDLATKNFNEAFDAFAWRGGADELESWRAGRTGYPLVDAGMRQLWRTGWMHNRVRMVVASFLVKHLLVDWRRGEEWFWDTLVDADPANNAASWQWVAGSGADAAPYFRIFNPILQAERFDPDGRYVRRNVPELADLPDEHIHQPWRAPAAILDKAGVKPGKTYPLPVIDHARARQRALAAYERARETT